MADRGERMGARDERMGRRVHEGLDGGHSRHASMKGSSRSRDEEQHGDRDAGHGGEFGATDDGTRDSDTELEPGATEARTRPGDVGRQAESGMETRPEEGTGTER